jgi:hypothetical protein
VSITAENVRAWLEQHQPCCMFCESAKATTILELWQEMPDYMSRVAHLEPSDCTAVCEECLRELLRPVPHSPFDPRPSQ